MFLKLNPLIPYKLRNPVARSKLRTISFELNKNNIGDGSGKNLKRADKI